MVNKATANVATVTWMTSQKLLSEGSNSLAAMYQTVIAIPSVNSTGPMTKSPSQRTSWRRLTATKTTTINMGS